MITIAVDPGTRAAGYAVVKDSKLMESKQMVLGGSEIPIGQRLFNLYEGLVEYMLKYVSTNETIVGVIESPVAVISDKRDFVIRGGKNQITHYESRGVVKLAFRETLFLDTLVEVTPAELKRYATGNHRAQKQDVTNAMMEKVGKDLGQDEADAVAMAFYINKKLN